MTLQVVRKPGDSDRIRQALRELERTQTKVGWFESAKYVDGTPVAYVATIQEFGYAAGGLPPRPFFRPTIVSEQAAWRTLIAQASKGVVTGKRTSFQAMELIGLQAAGDVRKTISQIITPALSPSTIAARKKRGNSSTKPLVDTRVLINTLTHQTEVK